MTTTDSASTPVDDFEERARLKLAAQLDAVAAIADETTVLVDMKAALPVLRLAADCASTDDARPTLTKVRLTADGEGRLTVEATDSYCAYRDVLEGASTGTWQVLVDAAKLKKALAPGAVKGKSVLFIEVDAGNERVIVCDEAIINLNGPGSATAASMFPNLDRLFEGIDWVGLAGQMDSGAFADSKPVNLGARALKTLTAVSKHFDCAVRLFSSGDDPDRSPVVAGLIGRADTARLLVMPVRGH